MNELGQHTHSLVAGINNISDPEVKGFSLYTENEDIQFVIVSLENALSKLKSGEVAFKESCTMVGNVSAKYVYPHRPHCAMMGTFWDE